MIACFLKAKFENDRFSFLASNFSHCLISNQISSNKATLILLLLQMVAKVLSRSRSLLNQTLVGPFSVVRKALQTIFSPVQYVGCLWSILWRLENNLPFSTYKYDTYMTLPTASP